MSTERRNSRSGPISKATLYSTYAMASIQTIRFGEGADMPASTSITFAPAPWAWESSKIPGGRGGNNFNLYITDANGRKIAAVWGKPGEKEVTCKLIVAAPAILETLRDLIKVADGMVECADQCDRARAAIALAENSPP